MSELSRLRARVSGLHFAKAALSASEMNMLYIGEGLLTEIDLLQAKLTSQDDRVSWMIGRIRHFEAKYDESELNLSIANAEVEGLKELRAEDRAAAFDVIKFLLEAHGHTPEEAVA